ncbi:MAG: hypothetical protein AABM42_10830 [Actinomycetota bacterium]
MYWESWIRGGPRFAYRGRHRQLVWRKRFAVGPERPVASAPLILFEHADLLEGRADDLRRGLVEEHDAAVRVDQERGDRDDRDQIAGQDQLERLLVELLFETLGSHDRSSAH